MAAKTVGQNISMITAVFLPERAVAMAMIFMWWPTFILAQIPNVYSSQTTFYLYGLYGH